MVKAEEVETRTALAHIDDPALVWVQPQIQPLHDDAEPPEALHGRCLAPAHDDKVIRVPRQHPQVPASVLPHAIELVQDDVGK